MNSQLSLSGFEMPEYYEQCFLDTIANKLRMAVSDKGADPNWLIFKNNKDYSAVLLSTFTSFRLRFRGKQHYISLPTIFQDIIPQDTPTKHLKSDPKYIRILLNEEHPAEYYIDFLIRVVGETVNRYPKEYDCCSRYLECSDAKSCVHPDKEFALACGYRKVLISGRVFFGQNRNIG